MLPLGDLETLGILKRNQYRFPPGVIDKRDMYGDTPLQSFDGKRRQYLVEDEETHLKSRDVVLSMLELEEKDHSRDNPVDNLVEDSESDTSDVFLDVEQDPQGAI